MPIWMTNVNVSKDCELNALKKLLITDKNGKIIWIIGYRNKEV